jgi:hypothetical protein
VNVSPELTAFDAVSAPVHRQLPAVGWSQIEMCEYVSDVETDVHVERVHRRERAARSGGAGDDLRVVSPAAFARAGLARGRRCGA